MNETASRAVDTAAGETSDETQQTYNDRQLKKKEPQRSKTQEDEESREGVRGPKHKQARSIIREPAQAARLMAIVKRCVAGTQQGRHRHQIENIKAGRFPHAKSPSNLVVQA